MKNKLYNILYFSIIIYLSYQWQLIDKKIMLIIKKCTYCNVGQLYVYFYRK